MVRILCVSSDVPYPPDHGGRLAVWEHAKSLAKRGYSVDLVATGKAAPTASDIIEMKKVFNDINFVPRSGGIFKALGLSSYQVASRRALSQLKFEKRYDVLLVEGAYVAPILENKSLKYDRFVYRVHNDERAYFKNLASSSVSVANKAFYHLEAERIERAQRRCLTSADISLFISEPELNGRLGRIARRASLLAYSPEGVVRRDVNCVSRAAIFVGSLFMVNNQRAIDWYLGAVHQKLLDIPGYRFVIAGRADPDLAGVLTDRWSADRVEVNISPSSLREFYDSARVFVNPAVDGAGVKVKVLEAIANHLPVVSTEIGADGLQSAAKGCILTANSGDEFASRVREILLEDQLCANLLAKTAGYLESLEGADWRKYYERPMENT